MWLEFGKSISLELTHYLHTNSHKVESRVQSTMHDGWQITAIREIH